MLATWKNVDLVEVAAGEYLFHIGEPDIYVYVVQTGTIQLVINDPEVQAREKFKKPYLNFKKIKPGSPIFSTLSFLDVITGHPGIISLLKAIAIEDSTVLKIPN